MRFFQKSGFVVRISSRIITVIRVAGIIKQIITDLMSYSQFYSLNLFIFIYVWFNFWDKYMITGRINQVVFFFDVGVARDGRSGRSTVRSGRDGRTRRAIRFRSDGRRSWRFTVFSAFRIRDVERKSEDRNCIVTSAVRPGYEYRYDVVLPPVRSAGGGKGRREVTFFRSR